MWPETTDIFINYGVHHCLWFLMAIGSTHFEKKSVINNMFLFPFYVFAKWPVISTATSLVKNFRSVRQILSWEPFRILHLWHFPTHFLTSDLYMTSKCLCWWINLTTSARHCMGNIVWNFSMTCLNNILLVIPSCSVIYLGHQWTEYTQSLPQWP